MKNTQLQIPLDAILFDCDGTLSSIEGIDELARENKVEDAVSFLTAEAMGKTGLNLLLYQERLAMVKPTCMQVKKLAEKYFTHKLPDIEKVIAVFKRLNKKMYVVSAGLYPAVSAFAELLGISRENVFAVNIYFDSAGQYIDFDHATPLVVREGKRQIVEEIKKRHPRVLLIGDGLNDLAANDLVSRFVGFGGAYNRKNIEALCQFYITKMLQLLPLALTEKEFALLSEEEKSWYRQGLR